MSDTVPSAAELASVSYMSAVSATGTLVATSFHTWNGDSPPTYSPEVQTGKWDNNASGAAVGSTARAGTAGGTVTYAFDPSVSWTAAEQQAFVASLTLWSDETNVKFVQDATASAADFVITLSQTYATQYLGSFTSAGTVGSSNIPVNITKSPEAGYQPTLYFNTGGGYGELGEWGSGAYSFTSIVHELGHALGLGHPGPYNDGDASAAEADQQSPYDSRLYSVMSYIDPGDTLAADFSQYPVTGTDWMVTSTTTSSVMGGGLETLTSSFEDAPQTPMRDDILAAQELYGAPTQTALSGGQVFGFHCNVADASEPFFDFAINVDPVITLWDAGGGNTLDISGYTMDCAVDLLPGSFSSVDNLTNNIGIAFGTRIDEAVGGSGDDLFTVNADSDTIIGGGGTNTVVFSGPAASYVIKGSGGTISVTEGNVTDILQQVQTLRFADMTLAAPCFRRGTEILTRVGPRAVERVRPGDQVVTCGPGGFSVGLVKWVGHRRVDVLRHAQPELVRPVRIWAHAFADGLPFRDLWLSPDHAVFVEGVMIPVKHLINDRSIAQVETDEVEYWHIELERHDVVFAEGLQVESYLDTGNRAAFENQIRPRFAASSGADACAPLVEDGACLVAVKARLSRRAGVASRPVPWLQVTAGMHVLPTAIGGPGIVEAMVPEGVREVRLRSPTWVPAACEAASLDRRRLGIRVFEVKADRRCIDLGSAALAGIHPPEITAEGRCCWTKGDAIVAIPAGTRRLTFKTESVSFE